MTLAGQKLPRLYLLRMQEAEFTNQNFKYSSVHGTKRSRLNLLRHEKLNSIDSVTHLCRTKTLRLTCETLQEGLNVTTNSTDYTLCGPKTVHVFDLLRTARSLTVTI
ncbi:hypothetical protein JTE90_023877 [Oedothorax gibbosus]|uniref:Uncharacterized protein n=1 Tax=Oedothorax gibbosus TaxID=931172 RepID=A0AAV6UM99_9ARAC|nr:hypothetical protein JTE90_023877 [Oedothorax gibbosus]